jgi:hypothetical protein
MVLVKTNNHDKILVSVTALPDQLKVRPILLSILGSDKEVGKDESEHLPQRR